MRFVVKGIASFLSLSLASVVCAGTVADVEKRLKEQYPATKITAVRESPVKGVFEVIMGRNVAYTDDTGRYMIFGHVYDMKERRDHTASVLDEINRIDVASLPEADAIKMVRGKGERKLYVFSDPDCPFCKRLEVELAKLDNVEIYIFPYPLDGLHPDAKRKAEAIWCAKDRAKAWQEYMKDGKLPESDRCETPIDRNIKLASSLNINGTPTIIFANGTIAAGVLPAEEIQRRLALASDGEEAKKR